MAITTGKVRASYVHVFQPRVPENGGEPKYSVTLLIPKTDAATLNALYADIERAKQEGAQKVFSGTVPPACKIPIYDGDGYRPSGEAFGEECRGCMVMTASAKQQPVVVGVDMQNILNPADLYSGCYIRANVNFFAYNSNGNKGVGCGLNAVQKIADGEPLSMRVSAEDAFGGANAYNGAPAATQPYQAVQPQGYPGMAPAGYPQPAAQPVPVQPPYQAPAYPVQAAAQGGQAYQTPPITQSYQAAVPQAQGYPAGAIDPITGRPVQAGGVMGI